MKFIFYISICLLFFGLSACQTSTNIYIVRHAEKSIVPADDPHLLPEGMQRAEALKDFLKNKNIGYIFSTNTNRTVKTATPLSQAINIPVQYYNNNTLPDFLQMITGLKKNVLIVAHSNTILTMLGELNLSHNITVISDDDYDKLFIITMKNGKAVSLKETTYGVPSPQK